MAINLTPPRVLHETLTTALPLRAERKKIMTKQITTITQAEETLANLNHLTCEQDKIKATYEADIARIKSAYEAALTPITIAIEGEEKALKTYIDNNRSIFKKPRARKTTHGSFGIRKTSEITIPDKEATAKELIDKNLKFCFKKQKPKINKKELKKLLTKDPKKLATAKIETGEKSFYKVSKIIVDSAPLKTIQNTLPSHQ
jgi:hypothetical protein